MLNIARAFLFLGLLPFAWGADFDTEACNCQVVKANFFPSAEAIKELALPLSMMAATPKITFLNKDGDPYDKCSSFVSSDDGHMFTSAHCVQACMKAAEAYTAVDGVAQPNVTKLKDLSCPVLINGVKTDLQILAVSPCTREERASLPREKCSGPEYAIVKTSLKAEACLETSSDSAKPGEAFMAVGFPEESFRRLQSGKNKDSDGAGQFVSSGEVIDANPSCARLGGNEAFKGGQQTENLMQSVRDGDLYQTTLDILRGSSGGPMVNGQGEVLGLAAMYVINNEVLECKGSTFFSPMNMVLKVAEKDFPSLNLGAATRCVTKSPKVLSGEVSNI